MTTAEKPRPTGDYTYGPFKVHASGGPSVMVSGRWVAPTGSEYWVDARWHVYPDLSIRLMHQGVDKANTFNASVPPTHRTGALDAAEAAVEEFLKDHPDDPWQAHRYQRWLDLTGLRNDVALARKAVKVLEHNLEQAEGGGEYDRFPLGASAGFTREAIETLDDWKEEK